MAIDNYQRLKDMYLKVFKAESDYIPLIINPPCPGAPGVDELWNDLESAVSKAAKGLISKEQVGADWISSLSIGLYQCISVPGLFGGDVVKLDGSEPISHPCLESLGEGLGYGVPEIKGDVIDRMFGDMAKAKRILDDQGYELSFPVTASPFDLAQIMLGEQCLISLIIDPEDALQFLFNITDVCIELTHKAKEVMGFGVDEYVTNRGMFFPGSRLPCDAIVNFSPELIKDFVLPVFEKFSEHFGDLCVHFCTEPAPSGHVLEVLLGSKCVKAVDNWQGPGVFLGEGSPVKMQDEIAVVSSLDLSGVDKIDAFLSQVSITDVSRTGGGGEVWFLLRMLNRLIMANIFMSTGMKG